MFCPVERSSTIVHSYVCWSCCTSRVRSRYTYVSTYALLSHVYTVYLWPNSALIIGLWSDLLPCSAFQPEHYVCTLMFIFNRFGLWMPLLIVCWDMSNIWCLLFYVSWLLLCYHARSPFAWSWQHSTCKQTIVWLNYWFLILQVVHGITTLRHIGIFYLWHIEEWVHSIACPHMLTECEKGSQLSLPKSVLRREREIHHRHRPTLHLSPVLNIDSCYAVFGLRTWLVCGVHGYTVNKDVYCSLLCLTSSRIICRGHGYTGLNT